MDWINALKRLLSVMVGVALVATVTIAIPARPAAAQSEINSTMLLFDLSGSMGATEADGRTRLDIAQAAMISAIGGLEPGSQNLGIRTFSDCRDSTLAAAPVPVDAAALADTIATFRPDGLTDIAFGLELAANDLQGQSGRHSIILLSDGRQTCPGDPCTTAQALISAGIDVIVNAIGIGLAGTRAEEQLACVAGATGGTVVTVDDADELFDVLDDALSDLPEGAGVLLSSSTPTPTCINSPQVQSDESLQNLTVGSVYDDNGLRRVLVIGSSCGFFCEDGFDANCDGQLGDFCEIDGDPRTVVGAGKCLEQLDEKVDPTEEVDENGNPTLDAILAAFCGGDAEPAPDMVEPCAQHRKGTQFETRADLAASVGDTFLEEWNERLADGAFESARLALDAAIKRYMAQGRTFLQAVRRVVLGEDPPAVVGPEVPTFTQWQELQAYPVQVDRIRDVRALFRGVSPLTETNSATTSAVLLQADPVWDCDRADFEFDGERLRWTGPGQPALYVSFLIEIRGSEAVELERTEARRPLTQFRTGLFPAQEYAVAVVAELAETSPEWLGTCITYIGTYLDSSLANKISELGLENQLEAAAGEYRTDGEYGEALQLEYLRALGEDMSFTEFTQIAADNFDAISGGGGQFDQADTIFAFRNPTLEDDVRAAAWRANQVFSQLDVANETNLKDRLAKLQASFAPDGNGLVSRDDLEQFPFKFEALVMLAPWLNAIDAAGETGGLGGLLERPREISDDDVDAFLDLPIDDDYIKYLAATVFERIGGGADWLDTQVTFAAGGTLLLERPTITRARPGTPQLTTPRPVTEILRQPQPRPSTRPGPRGGGRTAIVAAAIVAGTLGYEYLQAQAATAPRFIAIVDPITGEQTYVSVETFTQFPPQLWPDAIDEIIEHILNTGEAPEPDEIVVLQPGTFVDTDGEIRDRCTNEIVEPGQPGCTGPTPPDTYRDANGTLRDSYTGEIVDQTTGEPVSDEARKRREKFIEALNQGLQSPLPEPIELLNEAGEIDIEKAAQHWADVTASNQKNWQWADLFSDRIPTPNEQSRIRRFARDQGLVPVVPRKADGDTPDFASLCVVLAVLELPEDLWNASDDRQFRFLDNLLENGRPEGTTWHHGDEPGQMELVPFGIHNATAHRGPRAPGGWAEGSR